MLINTLKDKNNYLPMLIKIGFLNVLAIILVALLEAKTTLPFLILTVIIFFLLAFDAWYFVLHSGRSGLRKFSWLMAMYAISLSLATPYFAGYDFSIHALEHIYRIAQLFIGESSWTDRVIREAVGLNYQNTIILSLNLARIFAVIATVSGILALIQGYFDRRKADAKHKENHIVLCGLGEAGFEFVRAWQRRYQSDHDGQGRRLLVIERNPQNSSIELARDLGFGVLVGDAFDPAVLNKAGVSSASAIVMMLSDDKRNIELALEIREWVEENRGAGNSADAGLGVAPDRGTVRLLIHVDDTKLARRLQDHSRAGTESNTETRFFDFYETAARLLFKEHPAVSAAQAMDSDVVHLAIYGFGRMGDSILRQALKVGISPEIVRIHISIFDSRVLEESFARSFWRANACIERLIEGDNGYKPINLSISFHVLEDAWSGIDVESIEHCTREAGAVPPTQHLICFDSDELGAGFSLELSDALRELEPFASNGRIHTWNAPIYVRLKRRHGLAKLYLESDDLQMDRNGLCETPDNLFAFGMLDDLVEPTMLLDDERDDLARILHENGYKKIREKNPPSESIWRKESDVPWSHLPIFLKGSNRAQADHIPVKLQLLGCTIAKPTFKCGAFSSYVTRPFWKNLLGADDRNYEGNTSDNQHETLSLLDQLSGIEHDRWSIYHYLEGWQLGKHRVNPARRHDNLKYWQELDASTRKYDAAHILEIPDRIEELSIKKRNSRSKKRLCLEIRVALIGHRTERLKNSYPELFSAENQSDLAESHPVITPALKKAIEQIRQSLQSDRTQLPIRITFVSPLAEGGDRMLAKAALQEFGSSAGLEVPLPLPWEVYLQTFPENQRKDSVEEFKLIARNAQRVIEIPSRFGTLAELGNIDRDPKPDFDPHPHEKQYQLANAYIAQHCDYLIALWDGAEISTSPETVDKDSILHKLKELPDGSAENPYTENAKPGGIWEAIRWWLETSNIPEKMHWRSNRQPFPTGDQKSHKDRLLVLGSNARAKRTGAEWQK